MFKRLMCLSCHSKLPNGISRIGREQILCQSCKITWRDHAIITASAIANGYGQKTSFVEPQDLSKIALGISDSKILSIFMNKSFSYTNTELHRFPKLDLTQIPTELSQHFDVVSCVEVLEHVIPPVERAITNLGALLKPNGVAIISVPLVRVGESRRYEFSGNQSEINTKETIEYYPDGEDFQFDENGVTYRHNGKSEYSVNPEFHGGDGLTLTFRLWALADLKEKLLQNGFSQVFEPREIANHPFVNKLDAGILIARK